MKRKTDQILLSVILIVAFLLLASCAPKATPTTAPPTEIPPTEAPPTQPPAEKVKIVFWSHDFPPREKLDRQYMDKFKQENPNVEIEYVLGPGDDIQYLTKLTTALAGGEGPDCFNLLSMSAGRLLETNSVAPLDLGVLGYSSIEEVEKLYVPGTLGGLIKDGKLYALPSEVSNYALFVNTKAFQDAGLDPDKDSPKTWDELIPLAQKLNKVENGKLVFRAFDFTYGSADDVTSGPFTLAGMAYQLGGTILNEEGTESTVNTEPWVRSLQFIQDWVYKEKLGDPTLTVAFIGFYEGSVGMVFSGSWYIPYIKDQGSPVYETFTVKPSPRWKDAVNNTGSVLYAYGLFVNANTTPEKQKACAQLIKELSGHPEEYLSEAGLLQPTIALTESETFKNTPHLDVFLKDMEGTPYWPTHPKSFEIHDVLLRALQRVVTDQQPVQESLDQAKQEMDEVLKSE